MTAFLVSLAIQSFNLVMKSKRSLLDVFIHQSAVAKLQERNDCRLVHVNKDLCLALVINTRRQIRNSDKPAPIENPINVLQTYFTQHL